MNLEKVLQNYGLTEKQAKIYLACLELGSASVNKISQKSGILRSTSYEILQSLHEMGIVSTFLKKKVRYFSADDPRQIIDIAKQKMEMLENALPQFRAIYGISKTKPTVKFYQGKEQMNLVMEEILKEARELLTFASSDDFFTVLADYCPKFIERRVKNKIPIKAITIDSEKARERKLVGPQILMEVRIIPKAYQHHGLTFIWANKMAMFSFEKDLSVLVVENEELTNTQKSMFNYIWDTCEH